MTTTNTTLSAANSAPDAAGVGGRQAPVADWVTIPELYDDPFPTFDRLRAEGGVHWVPAVGRYLVTSYDAVHDTELDQETFSANEEGSLMIRAMGHSMLRKDDPQHRIERKAWEGPLRPGAVKRVWTDVFRRNARKYLSAFVEKGPGADLVWDFAAPFAADNLREIIGLYNCTAQDIQRWSQTMIDATGNYADDPKVWEEGKRSFDEVDEALDEMLVHHAKVRDASLISHLLSLPDYVMPIEQIRANLKMTIGGGLNEPRDAIGVGTHALLTHPRQRALVMGDPSLWATVMDETIRWVAPIGMYSRQVTKDTVLQGVHLPAGAKLGICLLSANRDTNVWERAEEFDIRRDVKPHLAFGKGVHVCAGAWVAKAEVADVALPALFHRLPDLALDPDNPPKAGGWVFRGMDTLPVTWKTVDPDSPISVGGIVGKTRPAPRVAIIGSGPSGSFTAQALRRTFPDARLHVFDRLPVPFGLVRSGVAADHQGTKSVARQFERLYVRQAVNFHGNVDLSTPQDLAALREQFDAVVLATGLRGDRKLGVPGDELPGVYGAGRITRSLNRHADEEAAPRLGRRTAVVGMGNVAIDIVRLLARDEEGFHGTDIDDEARATMAAELEEIHILGRSGPGAAKFDPVMVRELADLPGIEHVVHYLGDDGSSVPEGVDARWDAVRTLGAAEVDADAPAARVRITWWFDAAPERLEGGQGTDGSVEALVIAGPEGERRIDVDSVVTAVGFCADEDALVEPGTHPDGKVEPGLYVAGWLRRGPRGTIPDQRADARGLASLLAEDIAVGDLVVTGPDRPEYEPPAEATTFDQWRRIDLAERLAATPGRVRSKLVSLQEMLDAARNEDLVVPIDDSSDTTEVTLPAEGITILVGTESGNAELVAEALVEEMREGGDIKAVDLGEIRPEDLETSRLHVLVCSTYGDGELPTNTREFYQELVSTKPDLSGLRYAVFGLGDKSYAKTYSRGSEILSEALERAGAQRVGEYGRHDAGSGEDASELAVDWLTAVVTELAQAGEPATTGR